MNLILVRSEPVVLSRYTWRTLYDRLVAKSTQQPPYIECNHTWGGIGDA